MIIGREEVENCLAAARDLGRGLPFMDCHVHPFEAMYGGVSYRPNPAWEGVYSTGDACYIPPAPGPFESTPKDEPRMGDSRLQARTAMLAQRRIYVHTGPKCLEDQMDLCGFSRVLLLPVLQPGEGEEGIERMAAIFGGSERFLLGYCVPNTVATGEVARAVERAVFRFGVRAVKLHPNVTRIDLRTAAGRERAEAILAAAGSADLPTVIHAGVSPALDPPEAGLFGTLKALEGIDLGVTRMPVVIAHAGAYGHTPAEVREEVLPRLERLFFRHGHLLADISGLSTEVLSLLLGRIGADRLLFGSDALYEPPWKMTVKLMYALRHLPGMGEDEFVRIAHLNPDRLYGKELAPHVPAHADQISSVS